jgi:LacI family transcriptional regulator
MVFDITDPFCTLILKGIQNTLQSTDYLPILMDAHNVPMQFERYLAMMLERSPEALIIIANWLSTDIAMLGTLERERIPMMMIGRKMEIGSMSSVMVDNEAGGYAAMKHLVQLGHRDIAIIRGPGLLESSRKRYEGMMRYAKEAKLSRQPRLTFDLPDGSFPSSGFHEGYRLTKELVARGERFSAVAAFDDLTAFGVMRALRDEGVPVPLACSVIGFDGVPSSAFASPGLTTVQQPMEDMGRIAAEQILRGIGARGNQEKQSADHSLLVPNVVVRESTAKLDSSLHPRKNKKTI